MTRVKNHLHEITMIVPISPKVAKNHLISEVVSSIESLNDLHQSTAIPPANAILL
jgi:hypothetical protein